VRRASTTPQRPSWPSRAAAPPPRVIACACPSTPAGRLVCRPPSDLSPVAAHRAGSAPSSLVGIADRGNMPVEDSARGTCELPMTDGWQPHCTSARSGAPGKVPVQVTAADGNDAERPPPASSLLHELRRGPTSPTTDCLEVLRAEQPLGSFMRRGTKTTSGSQRQQSSSSRRRARAHASVAGVKLNGGGGA
jgi:hypothetical protein